MVDLLTWEMSEPSTASLYKEIGGHILADGFHVDLGALRKASEGVTDTLDKVATKKVRDIDPSPSDFGHEHLGDTVRDFCDRWQLGVDHLAKDANEFAARLNHSVSAYLSVERLTQEQLNGIFTRAHGSDPGAE
ncbi:hypothetical protein ACFU7T_06115 [Streptomyces sp. NPDC057555]|uniref:hypothetical protein n=1 Tax=Streptomyces sp. NPDC057555 TaxID=3346166 RepID=UPI0036BEBEFE